VAALVLTGLAVRGRSTGSGGATQTWAG